MKQTRRASQRCDGFHLGMRLDIVERIANGGASRSCEPTRGERGQGQRGRCGRLRRGGLRPYVFLGTQVLGTHVWFLTVCSQIPKSDRKNGQQRESKGSGFAAPSGGAPLSVFVGHHACRGTA